MAGDEKAPPEDESAGATGRYAALDAGAAQLRESVKWLIATIGAIAPILTAGLVFTTLDKLDGEERGRVAALGVLAFLGIGFVLWSLLQVMVPKTTALPEVGDDFYEANRELFRGYGSDGSSLQATYVEALENRRRALRGNYALPPSVSDYEADSAQLLAKDIGVAVADVVAAASYESLEARMSPGRTAGVVAVALAAGLAVVGLVLTLNPFDAADDETPGSAGSELVGATLVGANLTGAQLSGADLHGANLTDVLLVDSNLAGADLRNSNLTRANLTNADLTGADLAGADVAGVTWNNTVCPNGELVKADACDID